MTRYAVDSERGVLAGAWATGVGDSGFTAAVLPTACETSLVFQAASELDALSRSLWWIYAHPASAVYDGTRLDGMRLDGEGWRREQERRSFRQVLPAIDDPCSFREPGLISGYGELEQTAHRLGRLLRHIDDADFTTAVRAEVSREIGAVERAELGDLSGRARQAVVLTRADASPPQVAAAHRLLDADLLENAALFTDVDSTAAAVAAAHWLFAAATVAARAFDCDVSQAVWGGDGVERTPAATLTIVLAAMQAGTSARVVVTDLIGEAMAVSEGRLPDLASILAGITHATETAEAADPGNAELVDALLSRIRSTPLDPARPAPSLLEALVAGIRACALLYRDYEADLAEGDSGSGDGNGNDGDGSASPTFNYWTPGEVYCRNANKPRLPSAAFIAAVRTQAEMTAAQL